MTGTDRRTVGKRDQTVRLLFSGYALLALVLTGVLAWVSYAERESVLAQEHRYIATLSRALEEHVGSTLDSTKLLMRLFQDDVNARGGLARLGRADAHRLLKIHASQLPQARAVYVYDATLVAYASSSAPTFQRIDGSTFEYITVHRDHATDDIYVGQPIEGRISGVPNIPVTMRLETPQGGFAGVIGAALSIDYFENFYRSLDLQPGVALALLREDGQALFGFPTDQLASFARISRHAAYDELRRSREGATEVLLPGETTPRLLSYRHHPQLPLIFVVSGSKDSVLAPWVRSLTERSAVLALFLALSGALLLAFYRQLKSRFAAEASTRASEARFRQLTQLSSDWYWESDAQHRFTFLSADLHGQIGHTVRDYVGKTRWEVPAINLSEDDWARHRAQLERREPFRDLVMCRRSETDGREVWISISGEPIFDEAGQFTGYRGVGHDITAQRLAEEEVRRLNVELEQRVRERTAQLEEEVRRRAAAQELLRQSEERFRAIATNSPDHLLMQDRELRYTFVMNPQLGLTEQDMLGKTDHDFLSKDDADKLVIIKRRVLQTGTPEHVETFLTSGDGGREYFDGSYIPKLNARGEVDGLVGYFRNVTDRKRGEDEISRLNADLHRRALALEAANRELESFSYSISHDLRAPLRAIMGFTELLRRDAESRLTEDERKLFERVTINVNRMNALIEDLLDFSRMSRAKINATRFALRPLVDEIVLELREINPAAEIHVGALPEVTADRPMLRQVLVNLIANALKFTSRVESPRVEIGSRVEGNETVCFVRDNGAGFDMRYADKLFGVFQRLHRAEEFDGTGVGLAIVHQVIQRHGGRVWAQSAPGQGATFFFTLS